MFGFQVAVIAGVFLLFSALIIVLLMQFVGKIKSVVFLLFPLFIFSLGFILRLTGKQGLVDLGYFLTEFSVLFVTVLFTLFLFLGQLKYWKGKACS